MSIILTNQQLEINNILSFKGRIIQTELSQIFMQMKNFIEEQGAKCTENLITATYSISNQSGQTIVDIEVLIPINMYISGNDKFKYKKW